VREKEEISQRQESKEKKRSAKGRNPKKVRREVALQITGRSWKV